MILRSLVVLLVLPVHLALAQEPQPRSIAVTGVGEVRVAPDRATLQLGVESRRLDLAQARREVAAGVTAFLAFCDELDIPQENIATSGITIRPEYSWNNNVRRLTGYFVGRTLLVDLTDLDKLGELIEGAVDQGVNQVSEPGFGLTDQGRYQRQAMALAAEDAKRNADTLAAALKVTVGQVISIEALGPGGPPPPQPMMMRMEAATDAVGAPETYRTGEIPFRVQVQARFAIADNG